ncbi:unnamed protein product, partial [Ostreobium quekettii]
MGGAVSMWEQSAFRAMNVSMKSNKAGAGGAVYADDSLLDLLASTIKDNSASGGGGGLHIRLSADNAFKSNIAGLLNQCTLKKNDAKVGGGLYFFEQQPSSGTTQRLPSRAPSHRIALVQSEFVNNSAAQTGGALFTNSPRHVDVHCESTQTLQYLQSVASEHEHGAIVASESNGMKRSNPCADTWVRNTAGAIAEGGAAATPAVAARICGVESGSCIAEGSGSDKFLLRNHTSGQDLEPFAVELLDAFGNPAIAQRDMRILVLADSEEVSLSGQLVANAGVRTDFTDVRLRSRVDTVYDVLLRFDPDDLPPLVFRVQVRECLPGEVADAQGTLCSPCTHGTYSFSPAQWCSICPADAQCTAATVTPNDGYWHSTSKSRQIHPCIWPKACKFAGRDGVLVDQAREAHLEGRRLDAEEYRQCSQGHAGVLCAECERSRGKTGSGECVDCGGWAKSITLAFFTAAWFVLLVYMVFTNAMPVSKPSSPESVPTVRATDNPSYMASHTLEFLEAARGSSPRSPTPVSRASKQRYPSRCAVLRAPSAGAGSQFSIRHLDDPSTESRCYTTDVLK